MTTSKYSATIGTEAEGRAMIGNSMPTRSGGVVVNDGLIRLLCGAVQDANPRYWEEGESPPALLFTWLLDMPWAPGLPARRPPMAIGIPLPGDQVLNVSQHVEFYEKIRVGDHLSMTETLISISDEKTSHLGTGHFVQTKIDVTRQDSARVATITNNLFRYQPR